jgi:hypothetical protein
VVKEEVKNQMEQPTYEAKIENYSKRLADLHDIVDEIVASIHCENTQKEFAAIQAVRKMLSRVKNPPIDTVIGLNLVPKLIVYLENLDDTGLPKVSMGSIVCAC